MTCDAKSRTRSVERGLFVVGTIMKFPFEVYDRSEKYELRAFLFMRSVEDVFVRWRARRDLNPRPFPERV
jgi:hypothetical protein